MRIRKIFTEPDTIIDLNQNTNRTIRVFKKAPFQTQPDAEDKIMNVKEAAAFLILSVPTMYAKTSQRLIPHFKKGNKLYFNKLELKEWVQQNKIKTLSEEVNMVINRIDR